MSDDANRVPKTLVWEMVSQNDVTSTQRARLRNGWLYRSFFVTDGHQGEQNIAATMVFVPGVDDGDLP